MDVLGYTGVNDDVQKLLGIWVCNELKKERNKIKLDVCY